MSDISYMTEIYIEDKDALDFLQYVATADIAVPHPVFSTYTLLLNEREGIKDEELIYSLGDTYMIVCDAVTMEKLYSWLNTLRDGIAIFGSTDITVVNKTFDISLLSIQGSNAPKIAEKLFSVNINEMWWFQCQKTEYNGDLRIEAEYTLYGHQTQEKQVLSQLFDEYTPLHGEFHLWEFSPIKWENIVTFHHRKTFL